MSRRGGSAGQAAPGEPRICCVGELMWDFHAVAGGSLEAASAFERVPGGAAANVALGLSAMGIEVAVSGMVAEDAFGAGLREALGVRGLEVSAVRSGRGRTGLVFIEGGERFLSYRPSFSGKVRLALPGPWCRGAPDGAMVHVAALDPDWVEPSSYVDLVRRARAQQVRISVDVNARPRAWRKRRGLPRAFRSLIANADIVKLSEEDAVMLGLEPSAADVRRRLRGKGTVVLTRAGSPTEVAGPWGQLERRPPRAVVRRVVGAGDAFCAGLLAALFERRDWDERDWSHALREAQDRAKAWLAAGM